MKILEQLKQQAEQAEVATVEAEETTVQFEANKLKASQVTETRGMATRVIRHGRLGFAASSDMEATHKLVSSALESAAYGDEVTLQFPSSAPAPAVHTFDSTLADLPIPKLVEMGQEILDVLLPADPDIRCNLTLTRSVQNVRICNHTGLDVQIQRSPFSIFYELSRVEGDDILFLYEILGSTVWEETYLELARGMVKKLELARKILPMRGGEMPVLFSPAAALALAIPLNEGLNGKNVYKGTSPLIGKIGEKLFDEKITVVDDGTLDGRFQSAPWDDEGVPHQRNVLVENGVLKGFLYDLKTAAQFGVETTGNGGRDLFHPPVPSPTNFIIQPGQTPLQEILSGIQEGLYVEDVLGIGQGNAISGAFSNPLALGYKIEKGEIVGRVKNVAIAGNVYDLLRNVAAISQETRWVYGWFCTPYILIDPMKVVSKA